MATVNLLYRRDYPINDKISVLIPTVGQVLESEDAYYNVVTLLTAMPIDMMVELDDNGIDFTTINDYDLFLWIFNSLRNMDTSLVFGDLDLNKFNYEQNPQNGKIVLVDRQNEIVIDRLVQIQIANTLRKIHHFEKNRRKPGNDEAKDYLLRRAREKRKHNRNKTSDSELESLIIALVNTEQYKYDFEGTKELTIYQFNESVRQVNKKIDYEHKMHGIYSGTVDPKGFSQDDLNWLIHK